MTETLFRDDAYLGRATAKVVRADAGGIVLQRTIFYPAGGGQPGDRGTLTWGGETIEIVDTLKDKETGDIIHVPASGAALPENDREVRLDLDWPRRYAHMRMHTCLHLLCAVVDGAVTGGQISTEKGRLDFNLAQSPDKEALNVALNRLIADNLPVTSRWIEDAELAANPDMVRTLSVKPPMGTGRVRVIDIAGADSQPCGGTHVRATGEIGPVRIGKIENKGKQNRRINILFEG
ncbi:alanyl-tRNA editing protein [Varunaivibrio sulfuroxidans]|uniref:Alanine--tRNA ligase n=1 Tax=Varunaivibrio sulfuroxidans TaxID=1773489 RepID=A0A4R3JDD3_9PROT|nr:alanyl-tRNA editing protein [Varunaivibrio sulfuroxidans]TCS63163.1 Ala-tRNA(Pro) hydrolase [Varunaivibrio sulfuroxidans]WES31775.1 alanyl-tRNA editing protein [Varunaivibrio sulfuroxidans]